MVYKPRNKRLKPEKVRANILARQEMLAKTAIPRPAIEEAKEMLAKIAIPRPIIEEAKEMLLTRTSQFITNIYTELQVAAETDPVFRSLIGSDLKETFLRIKKYSDALPDAERKEFLRQFMEIADKPGVDPIEILCLAFLANQGTDSKGQN